MAAAEPEPGGTCQGTGQDTSFRTDVIKTLDINYLFSNPIGFRALTGR
jgi:hypothetical protein